MTNRFPLIIDSDEQKIKELPAGDNLDLTNNSISAVRDILPEANNTYDLGSQDLRWKDIFLSGNSIFLGDLSISYANGIISFVDESKQVEFTLTEDGSNIFNELVVNQVTTLNGNTFINGKLVVNGVDTQTIGSNNELIENYFGENISTVNLSVQNPIDGQVDDISNHNTDALSEGNTNLYYTDERVRGAISASDDLSYDSNTGNFSVITYKSSDFDADLATKTTDDLEEGNTNLYFTDQRALDATQATIESFANDAYTNAVAEAASLANDAFTNAVSEAINLSDDAFTNAVSIATSLANDTFTNAVSEASSLADDAFINAVSEATSLANVAFTNAVAAAVSLSDDAFTNAVSEAISLANDAFTNAVSEASSLADDAFANAVSYADGLLAANDAMIFKGTLGTGGTYTALPTTHDVGWTIKVTEAGTYAGKVAEIGDMYVSLVSREGAGNQDTDWAVVQANIDGAVIGPVSSSNGHVAIFDGTTGKVIADGGRTPYDSPDFDNDFNSKDTDDLSEGNTNLYFTTQRVRDSVSANGDLVYDANTGEFSVVTYKSTDFDTDLAAKTSDDIAEGNTNLYFTQTRVRDSLTANGDLVYDSNTGEFSVVTYKSTDFDSDLAAKTTDDIAEGNTNLYFIEAPIDGEQYVRVNADWVAVDIPPGYDSNNFSQDFDLKNTDDLNEGNTNLYFTTQRVVDTVETETVNTISIGTTLQQTNTVSNAANVEILSQWSILEYQSSKAIITALSNNERQVSELLITHNSSNAFATEYGVLTTDGVLFTVECVLDGNTVNIEVTPNQSNTDFFIHETLFKV